MIELPSLVQRVNHRPNKQLADSKRGVDVLFTFDYMGASEFEFGALPRALKAMREIKSESWKVRTIGESMAAYFVGPDEAVSLAVQFFADQLKPRSERCGVTKEFTGIRGSYVDHTDSPPYDGWWSIDELFPPFILFKRHDHAEAWLEAL